MWVLNDYIGNVYYIFFYCANHRLVCRGRKLVTCKSRRVCRTPTKISAGLLSRAIDRQRQWKLFSMWWYLSSEKEHHLHNKVKQRKKRRKEKNLKHHLFYIYIYKSTKQNTKISLIENNKLSRLELFFLCVKLQENICWLEMFSLLFFIKISNRSLSTTFIKIYPPH